MERVYKNFKETLTTWAEEIIQEELNGLKELDLITLGKLYGIWLRVEKGLLKVVNQHRDTNHNVLIVSHRYDYSKYTS